MSSSDPRGASRLPSRAALALAIVMASLLARTARAEDVAGFAVERFRPAPPGSAWLLLDDLDLAGGLRGAAALSFGYALAPLRVRGDGRALRVVSDEAFAALAFSAAYDRFRFTLALSSPLLVSGESGTIDGRAFAAPAVNLEDDPDMISDVRLGLDARLAGAPAAPFRLGLGAELFVPSGARADYVTDGTYRGGVRVLAAGDFGALAYAADVGVHLRSVDEPAPGNPRGSELHFGAGLGARFDLAPARRLTIGPELFGESALRGLFGEQTTGLEALFGASLEDVGQVPLRVKIGVGASLAAHFGAPDWRAVVGFELFTPAAR